MKKIHGTNASITCKKDDPSYQLKRTIQDEVKENIPCTKKKKKKKKNKRVKELNEELYKLKNKSKNNSRGPPLFLALFFYFLS